MAQQPGFGYSQTPPPDPRRATIGWWGIGSVTAAAVAFAFLPASLLSGSQWAVQIQQASPIWAICACIGVATGLRGMQNQRYATRGQRLMAGTGTIASLIIFVAFTLIAVFIPA
jgi:hypothetical protein